MVRTIISITEEDKTWLDDYSHVHRQSAAKTVRQAIRAFQAQQQNTDLPRELRETAGIWKTRDTDGLDYVEALRAEWAPDAQ